MANRSDFTVFFNKIDEIYRDFALYPGELRQCVAAVFVKWAYLLRPESIQGTFKQLQDLLIAEGFIRESTIQNAVDRKIEKRFVFNKMMSFGPLNEEFSELELEDPFPIELNEKGKILLQLRRKVNNKAEIPFKRLDRTCFNNYPDYLVEEWEPPGYTKPNWSNFYFHAEYMKKLV
jgi:hypothetical protein